MADTQPHASTPPSSLSRVPSHDQPSVRLRDRRRLVRDRRRQGAPRARDPVRLLSRSPIASAATGCSATRTGCPRRTARCTSTPRASGWSTRDYPMPQLVSGLPAPHPDRQVLRRLRRPLRLPRADRVRDRRRARSARRATASGAVTLDTGETRRYDALLVANGHHWNPRWPEPPFPGSFDGDADALAPLHREHRLPRQERARRRDRQQRDGHRRRVELRGAQDVHLLAPRAPTSCPSTCSAGRWTRSASTR